MNETSIKSLLTIFEDHNLTAIRYKDENVEIELERAVQPIQQVTAHTGHASILDETLDTISQKETQKFNQVKAPLVGVYYDKASPEHKPFVGVGDQVQKGQTLCIIESMKVMNELKAPLSGKIISILPQTGDVIEFDQVLMEIE